MKQYLDACQNILDNGIIKSNRTGIDTLSIHGMMMKFNMDDGFPAVTTKKLAWTQMVGELIGFIRGYDNAADFRSLGCNIWDANANENEQWLDNKYRQGEDDLGAIYGVQARRWLTYEYVPLGDNRLCGWQTPGYYPRELDQLGHIINDLKKGIDNRRQIVTHWNPGELDKMSLPPCHLLYQFGIEGERLNLALYQRSADFPLGVPFNIASYSLLLHIVAKITGKIPGTFTHFLFDCHIYVNQIDGIKQQLKREPLKLPTLKMHEDIKDLKDIETWVKPTHFCLEEYTHYDHINFPFAV